MTELALMLTLNDPQVEPCTDVIVAGGTPVNFGWRRRTADPKKICSGAMWACKKHFYKIPEILLFYPKKFLMTFFSHRKLLQQSNKITRTGLPMEPIVHAPAEIK